jgi:hypothetical protein
MSAKLHRGQSHVLRFRVTHKTHATLSSHGARARIDTASTNPKAAGTARAARTVPIHYRR